MKLEYKMNHLSHSLFHFKVVRTHIDLLNNIIFPVVSLSSYFKDFLQIIFNVKYRATFISGYFHIETLLPQACREQIMGKKKDIIRSSWSFRVRAIFLSTLFLKKKYSTWAKIITYTASFL